MATIIDVAKLAGVSQGTASNVLNGKGNVSSEKIRAVEEAARRLGYTINERARILRKGSGNIICVIVPSMENRNYRDFYYCLKNYAEVRGFIVELLVTNNNRKSEYDMLQRAKAVMAFGVAAVTCMNQEECREAYAGFENLCFVERHGAEQHPYFGFDYELAGKRIAEKVISEDFHRIAVITDSMRFSNEHDFSRGLCSRFRGGKVKYTHITTDNRRVSHSMIDLLMKEEDYDAVVTSNIRFAEKIRHVVENFSLEQPIPIFTLSSVTSLPEQDYRKYELNYGLLGRAVAETLIAESSEKQTQPEQLFENGGFRLWNQMECGSRPVNSCASLRLTARRL